MTPKKKQVAYYALSPEQLESVLKLAREKNKRDFAMILCQYWHGLRAIELVSLTLKDLDRSQSVWYLDIKRRKDSLHTRQEIAEPKGRVLWNERRALEDYIANERGKVSSDTLFISRKTDAALDPVVWNRIFKGYAVEAGIPRPLQHCHCLKHSLGRHLRDSGAAFDEIRQRLGHASPASTMRYMNPTDNDGDKAARGVLKILP